MVGSTVRPRTAMLANLIMHDDLQREIRGFKLEAAVTMPRSVHGENIRDNSMGL